MSILNKLTATLKDQAARFGKQDDGAVAMVLGLAMLPFCMAVALSVDYGRAVHMNQKFASAMDSATIAAAKMVKDGVLTDSDIKDRAFSFFKENIKGNYAVYNDADFDLKIDRANSRVDVTLPVHVPTTFARIGGFEKMNISQKAQAVFVLRDIEVGLALDITGSMNQTPAGAPRTKLASLKRAFEKFANLMMPDTLPSGQTVRMGLAPYSAAINLGSFARQSNISSSNDGCVTERTGALAGTDAAPTALNNFRIMEDNPYDRDPTEGFGKFGRPNRDAAYVCPTAALTPMTKIRTDLITAVNSYVGDGWTAGHIGAQWAWNLVSPEWADVWGGNSRPQPYTDKKVVKAVILMTDGVFNTAYHNGKTSAAQALEMCTRMKAQGIQVFTLAFGLDDATAKATLEQCASVGPDYFVDAANEADLDEAFAKFAGKINALRLSQ